MSGPAGADEAALIAAAREAAGNAYAPYSGFCVGAAVRAEDGRVFTAANVENASYGLSLCAETAAMATAAAAGVRVITHIAVTAHKASAPHEAVIAMPCGRCRQVMAEFAGPSALVSVDRRGQAPLKRTLAELLPDAFGPGAMAED
ncbi:MAG: cytidine deaminase [Pseudomonadota bacterium]